jgi:hypothetical protein
MNEQMESLLAQAAALRAGGASWKEVAAAVGRDVNTVKHWPERFPEEWFRYLHAAQRHLLGNAYGESITTLRVLMRSQNEKSQLAASTTIAKLQHDQDRLDVMQSLRMARARGGKQEELSTEGQQIAGIVDGMSFEQMQEMTIRVGNAIAASNSGKALKAAEGEAQPARPNEGNGPSEEE